MRNFIPSALSREKMVNLCKLGPDMMLPSFNVHHCKLADYPNLLVLKGFVIVFVTVWMVNLLYLFSRLLVESYCQLHAFKSHFNKN